MYFISIRELEGALLLEETILKLCPSGSTFLAVR
jgi:hypothetical protein